MPLYEYQCQLCSHRFEQIQKFSDPPITECPKCGGPVEKLLSSPAIQFKGSGWYITDYARSGAGSEKTTKADEAAPAASSPAKTESAGSGSTSTTEKSTAAAPATPSPSKSD